MSTQTDRSVPEAPTHGSEPEEAADGSLDRRRFLRGSALAGAGLLAASALPVEHALAGARRTHHDRHPWRSATDPVTRSVYFGAAAEPRGGELTQVDALQHLEGEIGRKVGIMRRYAYWDSVVPDNANRWASDGGRVPYISLHAYNRGGGGVIPWRSIAAGNQDAKLRKTADALRNFGDKVFFNFHHEPENDPHNGSPADFRDAFDHVHRVFDSQGATNLRWVVTLMASTYHGGHGGASAWLPQNLDRVKIGVDGYNRWPVDKSFPWRSFAEIFDPARNVAQAHGQRLFVGEYGCVENGPGDKAAWFQGAANTVAAWPEVRAVVYSHRTNPGGLAYWADTSASSISAFKAMSQQSLFFVP